ncbi:MAG: hypothetical protein WBK55_05230 [Alphaproteobacteria bacterium]
MKRLLLVIFLVALASQPAMAEQKTGGADAGMLLRDQGNPQILKYTPPAEPYLSPVKFLKQDPPVSLNERVERLLHGIKVDISPEYDHYGYELRRYMAHVSGPQVFNNEAKIKEELSNIRKAEIILQYWRQEMMRESGEIAKIIEEKNSPTNTRTSFKYNSGSALAFLSECHTWIQKNKELLEFLLEKQGLYSFDGEKFMFKSNKDRDVFAAKFTAAIQARTYINEYVPFAGMVY